MRSSQVNVNEKNQVDNHLNSVCLDHEAQNFIGPVPQCRTNHSARFSRGSVCSFCHKLGDTNTMFLLGANEIETDSTGATTLSIATALSNPEQYFSSSGANYIYGSQGWYWSKQPQSERPHYEVSSLYKIKSKPETTVGDWLIENKFEISHHEDS